MRGTVDLRTELPMQVLIPVLRNIAAASDARRDSAVATFYNEAIPRLTPTCAKLLRKARFEGVEAEDLAVDAVHDSLAALVAHAASMTTDAKVLGYLRGTAKHHLTAHIRQSGGASRIRIADSDEPCLAAALQVLSPSHIPTGRDAIIRAAYQAAKSLLTPAQRGMAEGVLEEGQPIAVSAAALKLAQRTAYRRLREARTALEHALQPLVGPVLRVKPPIAPRPIREAAPRRIPPVTMSIGPAPLPRR